MVFNPLNEKAIIVVRDYIFPTEDELSKRKIYEKYNLKDDNNTNRSDIQVETNLPENHPMLLQQLKTIMPIMLKSKTSDIELTYVKLERRLNIGKKDFFAENDFDKLKEISEEFIDFKASEVTAIGLNFVAEFNLQDIKLQLLNKDVEKIEDFDKNLTFEFVLPIEYEDDNLIATYKIRKIKGGDNTGEDRYYETNVNFHFDLTALKTSEKLDKVSKKILNITNYNKFIEMSEKFLGLNDKK